MSHLPSFAERVVGGLLDLRAAGDRLAALAAGQPSPGPAPWCWPAVPLRNLLFLGIVLAHGCRRLLPPYDPGAE